MQIGNLIIQHFFKLGNFGLINNIFGDLFIGVLTMYGLQTISQGHSNHQAAKIWEGILIIALPLIFAGLTLMTMGQGGNSIAFRVVTMLPSPLIAENGFILYLGPLMYLLRKNRNWQMLAVVAVAILSTGFNFSTMFTTNFQWLMFLAIIPMYLYNGQLGRSMKVSSTPFTHCTSGCCIFWLGSWACAINLDKQKMRCWFPLTWKSHLIFNLSIIWW